MIRHYFKTGFRNLLKYKTQSFISIIGLAIGLTFFTVGYYWYRYETSYDSFYPESKHTYNIYTIDKQTGKMQPGDAGNEAGVRDMAAALRCDILSGICDGGVFRYGDILGRFPGI